MQQNLHTKHPFEFHSQKAGKLTLKIVMKVQNLLLVSCFITQSDAFILSSKTFVPLRVGLANSADDQEDSSSWDGFNPFERKETSTRIPSILSSNKISVRQMRMKELMSTLLTSEPEKYDAILLNHEELIMEPLNDDDAVLDEDSIYEPGMTREERFERYDSAMSTREASAVNASVKQILSKMRSFVMSRR